MTVTEIKSLVGDDFHYSNIHIIMQYCQTDFGEFFERYIQPLNMQALLKVHIQTMKL